MVARRRGRWATHYPEEREWLEDFVKYRELLAVALNVVEQEQDNAVRIVNAMESIGGGHTGPKPDKILTGIARYDKVLEHLVGTVETYARELAERMEAVDQVTLPEAKAVIWYQYICRHSMADVSRLLGIHRQTALLWGYKGLEEIRVWREAKKKEKAGA